MLTLCVTILLNGGPKYIIMIVVFYPSFMDLTHLCVYTCIVVVVVVVVVVIYMSMSILF